LLSELLLETGYSTGRNDLVMDFYVPCLNQAGHYDRAVGFFRSSLFILVGVAFSDFARRGGRMRLVCSPNIDSKDAEAIEVGFGLKEKVNAAIERDLDVILNDPASRPVVQFLSTLIARDVLDIRFACKPQPGIFHDKLGLFADAANNHVSFVGSANETFSAWDKEANHEGFEVFCSWKSVERDRVERHAKYFSNLWAGHEPGLTVVDFPEAMKARLLQYSHPNGLDAAAETLRQVVAPVSPVRSGIGPSRESAPKGTKVLQAHQQLAVTNWLSAHRGIINHATGSGKTLTALTILRHWVQEGRPAVVFVPTSILSAQWKKEIEEELSDLEIGVLEAGAGSNRREWVRRLADYTRDLPSLGPRIVIATMQTGSTAEFLERVKDGEHLLVVADEVHRLGSPEWRHIIGISAGGRLGLSATPERYGDPSGTAELFQYFGSPLPPPFTIGDAIAAGRLVPYDYFVHRAPLSDEEQARWAEETSAIRQAYARLPKSASGSPIHSEAYKLLLIRRARIAKQAAAKVAIAQNILKEEYKAGDRWLVYCDDTRQLQSIVKVCRALELPSYEYHSAMQGAQPETLQSFQLGGGVLVAIKCLDEGVDLPVLNRAIILASSKNPREFIQRRGRVLRSLPGKFSATIHDVIVVPTDDSNPGAVGPSLVRGELLRAREFATYCRNSTTRTTLTLIAATAGLDPTSLQADDYEANQGAD
jgi:superfamily II DNA or RNA helicase